MPTLTRRRDPDAQPETWLIHYDDIRVGSIAMRAGVSADKDQWGWSVGFDPASDRGLRGSGTAKSSMRLAPPSIWPGSDFTDYRRHRAFDAWKRAMWDAGLKLATQVADGRANCFCGATIGIDDMTQHVYTAHMEPKPPR